MMKNSQKGSLPLILLIGIVLIVGVSIYSYHITHPGNAGCGPNTLCDDNLVPYVPPTDTTGTSTQQSTSNDMTWQSGQEFDGFDKIAAYIQTQNPGVPILVPKNLPPSIPPSDFRGEQGKLHATVTVTQNSYRIKLEYGEDCGANACFAGYLEAKKENNIAYIGNIKIPLKNGITGYYLPRTCGGSCSPAQIDWGYKDVHYIIQMGDGKQALITMANESISNALQSSPQPTSTSVPKTSSGIKGIVLIGPTTPTCSASDPTSCTKPYQTTLYAIRDGAALTDPTRGGKLNIGIDGKFQVDLVPGKYYITPNISPTQPECTTCYPRLQSPGLITVVAGKYTDVTINFDSGIR